jgi:hypothetical protein
VQEATPLYIFSIQLLYVTLEGANNTNTTSLGRSLLFVHVLPELIKESAFLDQVNQKVEERLGNTYQGYNSSYCNTLALAMVLDPGPPGHQHARPLLVAPPAPGLFHSKISHAFSFFFPFGWHWQALGPDELEALKAAVRHAAEAGGLPAFIGAFGSVGCGKSSLLSLLFQKANRCADGQWQ